MNPTNETIKNNVFLLIFTTILGVVCNLIFLYTVFYVGGQYAPMEIALRNSTIIARDASLWARFLGFVLFVKNAAWWQWALGIFVLGMFFRVILSKSGNESVLQVSFFLKKICCKVARFLLTIGINANIISFVLGLHAINY